jgi:hypothetical protein
MFIRETQFNEFYANIFSFAKKCPNFRSGKFCNKFRRKYAPGPHFARHRDTANTRLRISTSQTNIMSSFAEVHTTTRDILAERISRKFK